MSTPQSSLSHLDWPEALSHPNRVGPQRLATAFNVGALSHPVPQAPALPSPDPSPGVCTHAHTCGGRGHEKGTVHYEHQPRGWDSDHNPRPCSPGSESCHTLPPKYSWLTADCHQPLPEPSVESPPPSPALVYLPALICWLKEPTINVTGTGQGQAPNPGERSPSLGKPDGS